MEAANYERLDIGALRLDITFGIIGISGNIPAVTSPLGTIDFLEDYEHILHQKFTASNVQDCMDSSGNYIHLAFFVPMCPFLPPPPLSLLSRLCSECVTQEVPVQAMSSSLSSLTSHLGFLLGQAV